MSGLCKRSSGFSLLEVVIALAILAMSLTVLLESQAAGVRSAGRSRDLTIATLLARSKMIDIEQELFDEGFVLGESEDDGDFEEEGYSLIKWSSKVSELEIDLSAIASLCGAFSGGGEGEGEEEGTTEECEATLGGAGAIGGALTSLTDELGRSLRLIELKVTWPVGKYEESFNISALVTREDFGIERLVPNSGEGLVGAGDINPALGGKVMPGK